MYFKGQSEPQASWNQVAFDDSAWASGPSGFGYGDGDDATVLSDMQNGYVSIYTRKSFDVPSPLGVASLELTVDWDDGFVAYVNGQEVARRNLAGASGTPVAHDVLASSHEAGTPVTIGVPASVLTAGANVLAVQAHNVTLGSTDLTLIVELRAANPPPAAPSGASPPDGATNLSLAPALCVTASDPNDAVLDVTFHGRAVSVPAAAPFTIIALPDTQFYAQDYPATYLAQTQWIVDQRVPRSIAFVTELGDCVNTASSAQQWINADAAWQWVESPAATGLSQGIPYGIAVGNHDQTPAGDPGTLATEGATTGPYNQYFGVARFTGRGYYGGHYGANNDNHYELFSAGGMEFIAIHMEYMPADSTLRRAVLSWADQVLAAHANRRAIVTAHYLLNPADASWSDQGQATWDALKGHHNLFLMLCGHRDQANRRYDEYTDATGTTRTHTLVSDYQTLPNGGNGWLRILTFAPQANTIDVETYSPWLSLFIDGHPDNTAGTARNRFTLDYDMGSSAPFGVVGAATVPGDSQACATWSGLAPDTTYEWYAVVSDGVSATNGAHATFTTGTACTLASESCNGTDDDCDAAVDEGYPDLDLDGSADCVDPDDDDDGAPDAIDCAPLDAITVTGPPPEVAAVHWDGAPGTMAWSDQGTGVVYDVVIEALSMLRSSGVTAAECLAHDLTAPRLDDDGLDPLPGTGSCYLVRARKDGCGAGTYGQDSLGVERLPLAACP